MYKTKQISAFLVLFSLLLVPVSVIASDLNVNRQSSGDVGGEFIPGQVLVKFKGDVEVSLINLPFGRSVAGAVKEYRGRKDVVYAEPNYVARAFLTPNDPYLNLQWHLDNPVYGGIHTKSAWDTASGSGVTVAIIDTGIAYENYNASNGKKYYKAPDLADTCFVPGYDFVENDSHPNDDNSHGTHVAGTVAQSTNNSVGMAGVAYDSCLMPVKVLNRNGSGTYSAIASGIRFAADNGARVINLSLGGSSSSQTLLDALAYAYAKGVTIVAAAGNDGQGQVSYPAAHDDYVIAVGATRFDETKAGYSNYGSSLDIMAPGGDTSVDQNGDGYGDGVLQNTFNPNNKNTSQFGYWFFQGTSMAAPHVAGVAALVLSNGNASTPAEVRRALEETADDLGTVGRDNVYGHGLVNALSVLSWLSADPTPSPEPTPEPTPEPSPEPTPTPTPTPTPEPTPEPEPGITLSVGEYKVKGLQKADLTWSGASGTDVVLIRTGTSSANYSTLNDGFQTDDINNRGGGSYDYQICETAPSVSCSNTVTVAF
jgi:serine protease